MNIGKLGKIVGKLRIDPCHNRFSQMILVHYKLVFNGHFFFSFFNQISLLWKKI